MSVCKTEVQPFLVCINLVSAIKDCWSVPLEISSLTRPSFASSEQSIVLPSIFSSCFSEDFRHALPKFVSKEKM